MVPQKKLSLYLCNRKCSSFKEKEESLLKFRKLFQPSSEHKYRDYYNYLRSMPLPFVYSLEGAKLDVEIYYSLLKLEQIHVSPEKAHESYLALIKQTAFLIELLKTHNIHGCQVLSKIESFILDYFEYNLRIANKHGWRNLSSEQKKEFIKCLLIRVREELVEGEVFHYGGTTPFILSEKIPRNILLGNSFPSNETVDVELLILLHLKVCRLGVPLLNNMKTLSDDPVCLPYDPVCLPYNMHGIIVDNLRVKYELLKKTGIPFSTLVSYIENSSTFPTILNRNNKFFLYSKGMRNRRKEYKQIIGCWVLRTALSLGHFPYYGRRVTPYEPDEEWYEGWAKENIDSDDEWYDPPSKKSDYDSDYE